jgi:hypothetical protein
MALALLALRNYLQRRVFTFSFGVLLLKDSLTPVGLPLQAPGVVAVEDIALLLPSTAGQRPRAPLSPD